MSNYTKCFSMSTHTVIKVILNIILVSQLCFIAHGSTSTFNKRVCETPIKPGDFMIGGMFDPYRSVKTPCDGELLWHRVSLVESMIYAIDLINKRSDILPNVSLGYEMKNNCFNEDITLWTMLTMTSPSRNVEFTEKCPDYVREKSDKVVAVIGPLTSTSSLIAAKVGGLYGIPVISYWATSDELSDTERFPFFFRTISPDKFQVGAIIDLLVRFNWKYIGLFYSVDIYGIYGARQIQLLTEKYGICLAINMPVSGEESLKSEATDIKDKLENNDKVSVIVIFSNHNTAGAVLRVVKDISRRFIVIGSDAWGPEYNTEEENTLVPEGSLFVRIGSISTSPFQEYYNTLPAHPERTSQRYKAWGTSPNQCANGVTMNKFRQK